MVSFAFPIVNKDGTQKDEYVQVDLMPTYNMEFTEFAYHSPSYLESKYKGLYRNELIFAAARVMDYNVLKKAIDKEGKEVDVLFQSGSFNLNAGLFRAIKSRMGKSGSMVKHPVSIEKIFLTDDPNKIVKMVFGPKFTPANINSFESTLKVIKSSDYIYKKKRDEVLKAVANNIIRRKLPLPEELKKYAS